MSKTCKICGAKSTGDYCFRHKKRKPTKRTPLRRKSHGKKAARNDTSKKSKDRRKSVKTFKTALDRIFSVFIRMRDADSEGYVKCFTSGQRLWWKDSQCGHFASRRFNATRWHEQNCHAQSPHSNMFLSGEQYVYGKRLDEVYGAGTADEIMALTKTDFKLTTDWLEDKISHYRAEVERLRKEKNLYE